MCEFCSLLTWLSGGQEKFFNKGAVPEAKMNVTVKYLPQNTDYLTIKLHCSTFTTTKTENHWLFHNLLRPRCSQWPQPSQVKAGDNRKFNTCIHKLLKAIRLNWMLVNTGVWSQILNDLSAVKNNCTYLQIWRSLIIFKTFHANSL